MSRSAFGITSPAHWALLALAAVAPLALAGCSTTSSQAADATPAPEVITVQTARVVDAPITRTVRVTGSLVADEQAEVSAEAAGRVVATPVERGTRVAAGRALVRDLAATETSRAAAEAEANAAQIEPRASASCPASRSIRSRCPT